MQSYLRKTKQLKYNSEIQDIWRLEFSFHDAAAAAAVK